MKKILIIDDDPEIVELTKKRLEKHGYVVIGALNAEDGFKKAINEKPYLILLDIIMPGKDGITLLRELKKNPDTSWIHVAMLTAKSENRLILEAQECGATDYFIKPFDLDELVRYVKRYIGGDNRQVLGRQDKKEEGHER